MWSEFVVGFSAICFVFALLCVIEQVLMQVFKL